ncbi:bifunctional hydroxymethylpyrimidine kinase/phosphomethylpyrimidine kinase [Alphaproteobacteria bacterium]|nr:bifunctional hydroxymethylpyrimidine kinase/phosphomethylpyrimidine kinase [Alphaproteobacteria bacterium]
MISSKINNLSRSVLVIAGSDPSGGAGIQADLKTLTSLGVYGMTAITALTVQNTKGVSDIHEVPIDIVKKQIQACLSDITANTIKIGMMHNAELIMAIYESLEKQNIIKNKFIKIILDPVMVAKGGHRLLKIDAIDALKLFIKKSHPILTPNIPEAEILTDMKIKNVIDMKKAGKIILKLGASNVILKGGHLDADVITDLLVDHNGSYEIKGIKTITKHTHGTGCTMASALSAGIAKSFEIKDAFKMAHSYVNKAITTAPRFGNGKGPINHCHSINTYEC